MRRRSRRLWGADEKDAIKAAASKLGGGDPYAAKLNQLREKNRVACDKDTVAQRMAKATWKSLALNTIHAALDTVYGDSPAPDMAAPDELPDSAVAALRTAFNRTTGDHSPSMAALDHAKIAEIAERNDTVPTERRAAGCAPFDARF